MTSSTSSRPPDQPSKVAPPDTAADPPVPAPVPTPSALPLAVRNGRFVVDGTERAIVGINASGAASDLVVGSPCGYPDIDLDLMFSVLPDRALVRVWFTQRMVTKLGSQERYWDPIDEVVAAAERAPSRPLLLVTLATGSGDCDGGHWRNRSWYEGAYRDPEPGMPNSYAGWVDEIVTRYANRDVVAIWEPVNEPDPSTCHAGHDGSGCFGNTDCEPGAAAALAQFFEEVGGRIHQLDPNGLVSDGGGGWCGWYEEPLVIENASQIDVVSSHDYHLDDNPVPDWMPAALDRSETVRKPLLIGEIGIGAGPTSHTVEERAELLAAKLQAQVAAGADAVLVWVYGGFDRCGYCIGPDDPIIPRLASVTL
jgi:hypothetical protein